jgi:predicted ABC-type ATPase
MTAPQVVVLGGPNGAGKSTVAPELLRNALGLKEFVNADQIACGWAATMSRKTSSAADFTAV